LHPENLVSTVSSSTLAAVPAGSDAVSTVDTTCAMTSLAPQLMGTVTGLPVSGGVMLSMLKEGPASEDEGDCAESPVPLVESSDRAWML
jgi:hypothetical protein